MSTFNIINKLDSIKEKLTDQEYMEIVNELKIIHEHNDNRSDNRNLISERERQIELNAQNQVTILRATVNTLKDQLDFMKKNINDIHIISYYSTETNDFKIKACYGQKKAEEIEYHIESIGDHTDIIYRSLPELINIESFDCNDDYDW